MTTTLSPDRQQFRERLAGLARKTLTKISSLNGRVQKATRLVLQGDVELRTDGTALVGRLSHPTVTYQVAQGVCQCKDYAQAPEHLCCHRLAAGFARKVQELLPPTPPSDASVEPPAGIDPRFITYLHGKPFVRYAGLLAHGRGLVHLTARISFHSETLVLASATATFQEGRTFTDWADATPSHVQAGVRAHWVRMALTRAKSRCLRDALGVDLVAVEDMGEGE
jgi:hypothetical protein